MEGRHRHLSRRWLYLAVATSAVRDAANRAEFLDRVKRDAGFDVEVITGDEEARRTLLGIRSGPSSGVTDMLALDIGGGSTEFILDRPGQAPIVRSIDIGVVRLRAGAAKRPAESGGIQHAREWVRRETEAATAAMPAVDRPVRRHSWNRHRPRGHGAETPGL